MSPDEEKRMFGGDAQALQLRDIREMGRVMFQHPRYLRAFFSRLIAGKVHPLVEVAWLHLTYGKPKEQVSLDIGANLSDLFALVQGGGPIVSRRLVGERAVELDPVELLAPGPSPLAPGLAPGEPIDSAPASPGDSSSARTAAPSAIGANPLDGLEEGLGDPPSLPALPFDDPPNAPPSRARGLPPPKPTELERARTPLENLVKNQRGELLFTAEELERIRD